MTYRDDFCAADLCTVGANHVDDEIVELVRAGKGKLAASGYSHDALMRAESALRSCVRERCPAHRFDRDVLERLNALVDEASEEPCDECRVYTHVDALERTAVFPMSKLCPRCAGEPACSACSSVCDRCLS